MLNSAFKKKANSLRRLAYSNFSLFSDGGSLRESNMSENAAQGTQEIDKQRSKSSPRALRAHPSEPPRASESLQNTVLEPPMASLLLYSKCCLNPPTLRLGVSDLILGGGLPPPTPSALNPVPAEWPGNAQNASACRGKSLDRGLKALKTRT